jgi:hypothetical protein
MKNLICTPLLLSVVAVLSACAGGGKIKPTPDSGNHASAAPAARKKKPPPPPPSLGNVLTTADGGQIVEFAIDQNGDDGVPASARDTDQPGVFQVSVETFNQNTGAITRSFAVETGSTDSYAVDGIFDGDVALVTHFYQAPGAIGAIRTHTT